MALLLEQDTGNSLDISSSASIGSFTTTKGTRLGAAVKLTSLNAAAATFKLRLEDASGFPKTYHSETKDAAADTTMYLAIEHPYVASGETLTLKVISSNASDSSVTWVTDWVDLNAVDVAKISGDATAADNLELQYDTNGLTGDTFPATQAQIGTLSTGSAAVNTTSSGVHSGSVPTTVGTPTNAYTDTTQLNGTYHSWVPDGTIEFAYEFNIGANASPTSIQWDGYVQSINDSVEVYARNWTGNSWDQIGTIAGTASATDQENAYSLTTAHVNTGANSGDVRIRFESSGGDIATTLATDRILCGFTITNQSIGYAQGAIWFDDSAGNTNTTAFVDGVADNPVSSWAAIKTLISSVGIKRVHVANGSTVTFDSTITNLTAFGENWTLALGSQAISGLHVQGAGITGVGTAGAKAPDFHDCIFGAATLPPAEFKRCGFGSGDGLFTGGSAGQYVFEKCFSVVPGSGTPDFTFAGTGSTTGINNRGWHGGYAVTLDSDCTISHEVNGGGGQTFTTAGADVELRGMCRSVSLVLSGAGTVQGILHTGPVTISGTATSTVNLYGTMSSVTDNSSGTTVTVDPSDVDLLTATQASIDAIEADTNELQADDVPGLIAALENLSAAQVNAEVVDVMNVDTLVDGKTITAALQILAAVVGGKVSGAGTGTEIFTGVDGSTVRVTVTVDSSGNRTAVVYG